MEKYEKISEKVSQVSNIISEVEKESVQMIKDILKERDDHTIDFTDLDMNELGVTYDGGVHPEYGTNAFSTVSAVYLDKDGNVRLDTEDDDEYSITRAQAAQGGLVAYNILSYMMDFLEAEEEEQE